MPIFKVSFKKNYLLLSIFIISLIIVSSIPFIENRLNYSSKSTDNKTSLQNARDTAFNEKWKSIISNKGAKKAYEDFKTENLKTPLGTQHDMAHLFGMLLYDTLGLDGLSICDTTFTYACYHSLVASALDKEGLSILNKTGDICNNLPDKSILSGCYHGIGHGILSYFGYDFSHLLQSLDSCNSYSTLNEIEWCSTGVFMEYNYHLVAGPNRKMRDYDPSNIIYPCDSVPEKFVPACFFQQTQWWLSVLPGSDANKIQLIETTCSQRSINEQNQCFKGLAIHIGLYVKWETERAISLCRTLSTVDRQESCLTQSAQEFVYNHKLTSAAAQICSQLSEDKSLECLKKIKK